MPALDPPDDSPPRPLDPLGTERPSAFDGEEFLSPTLPHDSSPTAASGRRAPRADSVAASGRDGRPGDDLFLLPGGATVGDFLIETTLGRGAFGVVYRARQLSLHRTVALKVVRLSGGETAADGAEGRSLAQLFHPGIVQVYSETIDRQSGVRLLAMQYVRGTTLEDLIRTVGPTPGGFAFVDYLERLHPSDGGGDFGRVRDELRRSDPADLVCRIGEQLADALQHAHDRGVLHRDVKPANVLVDRSGRPLLADFNLAMSVGAAGPVTSVIGGTLTYMSPEHIEAFAASQDARVATVDERSDLYSLAVVLWQLLTGRLPFPVATRRVRREELPRVLRRLIDERKTRRPEAEGAPLLTDVLRRALAPDPQDRPASAGEFRDHLAGVREARLTLRVSPPGVLVAPARRRPIVWFAAAAIIPQVFGSLLQITYNSSRVVGSLSAAEQAAFPKIVLAYNLLVYPLCVGWIARKAVLALGPFTHRNVGDAAAGEPAATAEAVDRSRRRALRLPRQAAIIACVGWFPGTVVFPLALSTVDGVVGGEVWFHFAVSFLLAGSLAATYGGFLAYGVVLRAIYPAYWTDRRHYHRRCGEELAGLPDRLRRLNWLTAVVPLTGAAVLVLAEDRGASGDGRDETYRFLVVSLIVLGAVGATVVGHLTRRVIEQVYACRGTLDDGAASIGPCR